MTTPEQIENILRAHVDEFPGNTATEKQQELSDILPKLKGTLELPMDDRRAAALLAIEAPKVFITMALGAIVAISALVQLGWNTFIRNNWVLALCFAAGTACFFSMYFGVLSINTVAKSGRNVNERWSVDRVRGWKNLQASIGVLAIVLFVIAVAISIGSPIPTRGVVVTLPGNVQASLPQGLSVSGSWSQLRIDGKNGVTFNFEPVPAGKLTSFEIKSQ